MRFWIGKGMRPKDMVTGLREALQDLLVPELRAIATKVDENTKQIQAVSERLDRFTQVVEERFATARQESDSRFLALLEETKALRQEMNERFLQVEARFAKMDERFAKVDERFEALRQETNARFEALQREMDERFARVDARFEALQREMNERFAKVDERFLKVEEQIADLRKDMASMNGKLDLIVGHIVDFKTLSQVVVRLDLLEKRVDALAQRLAEGSS
ncbi:hypothetical protein HRbin23_01196 [bacterium HR23]|nr:hypothetical protein HRbin23_01196 [bacterium HR23]